MVVVVSVWHHPSNQVGHGVLNFADHLRYQKKRERERKKNKDPDRKIITRNAISRWRGAKRQLRQSFQEAIVFPPWTHVTALRKVDARFSLIQTENKSLLRLRMSCDPAVAHLIGLGFAGMLCNQP